MDASTITNLPTVHRFKIRHPLANEVSVLNEPTSGSHAEIAFFSDDEWVIDPLIEFAGYAEPTSTTLVYRYVPKYLLSAFVTHWEA